jgi:hypothetical protein
MAKNHRAPLGWPIMECPPLCGILQPSESSENPFPVMLTVTIFHERDGISNTAVLSSVNWQALPAASPFMDLAHPTGPSPF